MQDFHDCILLINQLQKHLMIQGKQVNETYLNWGNIFLSLKIAWSSMKFDVSCTPISNWKFTGSIIETRSIQSF